MAQTNEVSKSGDSKKSRGASAGGGGGRGPSRQIRISKAMSWLLRHGADKQGISMDEQGYINVADLLKWQKMRKELSVTFEEVVEEVKSNDKQRFALLYMSPTAASPAGAVEEEASTGAIQNLDLHLPDEYQNDMAGINSTQETRIASAKTTFKTATAAALESALSTPNPEPSHYLIRATQGHSLKTISSSTYLTPITLSETSSIPSTVVHGTFLAAWNSILRTGGLRPMSRVHVHFATGPSLQSVLNPSQEKRTANNKAAITMGEEKAVISGMRSDAQILIYINIHKALELGIPFWRSENGVVLSDGVAMDENDDGSKEDEQKKKKNPTRKKKEVRLVPKECWDVVVEVGEGIGVIWREGKIVKELPEHLKTGGWPHRKARNGVADTTTTSTTTSADTPGSETTQRGCGKKDKAWTGTARAKPRLNVER